MYPSFENIRNKQADECTHTSAHNMFIEISVVFFLFFLFFSSSSLNIRGHTLKSHPHTWSGLYASQYRDKIHRQTLFKRLHGKAHAWCIWCWRAYVCVFSVILSVSVFFSLSLTPSSSQSVSVFVCISIFLSTHTHAHVQRKRQHMHKLTYIVGGSPVCIVLWMFLWLFDCCCAAYILLQLLSLSLGAMWVSYTQIQDVSLN